MTEVTIDVQVVELAIGKLEIAPGDTLVLRLDLPVISVELANRLREIAKGALPDGVRVLVLDNKVRLSVVKRQPGDPADEPQPEGR